MPRLEETETVITWTAADTKATVYTLMPKIALRCRRAGAEEVRKEEGIRKGKKEAWTFLVDPSFIVIRKRRVRKLTDEQRAEVARRLRNGKTQQGERDPNSEKTTHGTFRP